MSYRVAILTVSDTASQDAAADKSGPLIKDLLVLGDFQVVEARIVSDDEKAIRRTVREWSGSGEVDWIITTGGTGFGVRDRTPEAVQPILEREAPGIVHLLLSSSIAITPLAALSRPIAGTIRDTLLVTLPGSAKAVRENLTALLDAGVVKHALELIKGGSGKELHSMLAKGVDPTKSSTQGHSEALVHHHHQHRHSHDHTHSHAHPNPRLSTSDGLNFTAASRERKSPYPLISFENALHIIMGQIKATSQEISPVTPRLRETVLAEDVFAPGDVPSSNTTNMDGYAVRSTDPAGVYRVVTPQTHTLATSLPTGVIYRINTGAPLPSGTDSVVIVEDTELVSATQDGEETEVRTLVQTTPGENIRSPGSDVRKGDLVLRKGEILRGTGGEIGTLAFVGRKEVLVHKKPVVAIMSTGNEIVDLQVPQAGQSTDPKEGWTGIYDTNRPSLQTVLETYGYEVIDLGIVKDDIQSHITALKTGLEQADIVLTTGGTSMGASDLLKPVIETRLGGTIHFGRVTIKPGKPTTFATIPCGDEGFSKPLFALPGNPASALVCFYIFVIPALRKLGGWPDEKCQLPRVQARITHSMRLDPRTEFHRVIVSAGPSGFCAQSTGGQRSSRIASLSGANGLVILPQKKDNAPAEIPTGELVDAMLIGDLQLLRN